MIVLICLFFFFFKQKTAYEMRISDWSSDVCSSDLLRADHHCLHRSAPDDPAAQPLKDRTAVAAIVRIGIGAAQILPRKRMIGRSEERSVGKECVSTCRSRWTPYHYKKQQKE